MKQPIFQKTSSVILPLLLLLTLLYTQKAFGQEEASRPAQYIGIQTGFTMGPIMSIDGSFGIHNAGLHLFGEYKREIGKNWFYGISLTGMLPNSFKHFFPIAKNVSGTAYYRIRLVRDRLYLLPGLGLGSNFVFLENEPARIVPTMAINFSMLWRIDDKVYLDFSPLVYFATRLNAPLSLFINGEFETMSLPIPSLGVRIAL